MSDLLGEALAWVAQGEPPMPGSSLAEIVAAARNWHTLTNPTDELIDRLVEAADPVEVFQANDGKPGIRPRNPRDIARSVVDALTVTAEPQP